jgi:hypothetical protein
MEKLNLKNFKTTKKYEETIPDILPKNMHYFYQKINELVDEVNSLRAEVERLERVKAKRQITFGGI